MLTQVWKDWMKILMASQVSRSRNSFVEMVNIVLNKKLLSQVKCCEW